FITRVNDKDDMCEVHQGSKPKRFNYEAGYTNANLSLSQRYFLYCNIGGDHIHALMIHQQLKQKVSICWLLFFGSDFWFLRVSLNV
ncbi:hypothetical protein L2735_04820, partial [Shewanella olleyana]|uniref:hypothetical protein n=1 Tax=Shewanella olleyana TaxID=135626 RepID=UPI00200C4F17